MPLLESVEAGKVDPPVIQSLEKARRDIGEDASFGVTVPSQENGRVPIDSKTIERLPETTEEDIPEAGELTVTGRLHLIEVEEPERVGIRDTHGVNWVCIYDPELEPTVLALVKALVWATGEGARHSARSGKMHLQEIRALPQYDQSSLFTFERVSVETLEQEQRVADPQGLAALEDAEWSDDEQDREFLALVLDDHAES